MKQSAVYLICEGQSLSLSSGLKGYNETLKKKKVTCDCCIPSPISFWEMQNSCIETSSNHCMKESTPHHERSNFSPVVCGFQVSGPFKNRPRTALILNGLFPFFFFFLADVRTMLLLHVLPK